MVKAGLSPRMRGNLMIPACPSIKGGSIPAHAGEPAFLAARAVGNEVYPRACGGTPLTLSAATRKSGLSPRMRGNRPGRGGGVSLYRSIPAHAGEPARFGV